ncbi:MAG: T9SS type A sorting domain-containing protein [Bacteroidales bacterium]|jgi:hypothetical protein|nr:T9SS type A sorting domain-containing protein [Bacteroidales bacterium]MDD4215599.1 T9SS type A sorting domain-containing protein [Bacteroidales bacterium]
MADGNWAYFYVRTMDQGGKWSHTNIDSLVKRPLELIQSSTQYACYGDSVKLSCTNAIGLSYTWLYYGTPIADETEPVMYAKLSGDYQVVVYNALECRDTSTVTTVVIHPQTPLPGVTSPVHYCLDDPTVPLSATGADLLWYDVPSGGVGSVTPPTPLSSTLGSTQYYVNQTLNNCEGERAELLVVVSSPSSTSISPQACEFYLSPEGNIYDTDGIYHDTIQNVAGCDSVITIDLTVIHIDTSVVQNDVLLTANQAGAAYQWLDCNNNYSVISGADEQSFTPTVNGSYAVELTFNGCVDTSLCHTVSSVGIADITGDTQVFVYPNPLTDKYFIEFEKMFNNVSVSITDISGRLVENSHFILLKKMELELNAPAGVYYLKIQADEKLWVLKLIKL